VKDSFILIFILFCWIGQHKLRAGDIYFHKVTTSQGLSHNTRGVGRGSACFPIRSVRSEKYKYIWNLNHEEAFYNMVTANRNSIYYDWLKVTEDDPARHDWVKKYMLRPAEELYNLETDPYEMTNLADNPEYEKVKKQLRRELEQWMEHQGDEGGKTEMQAVERQERDNAWKLYSGSACQ
jgi:N-sulfoglucosamine sulfohydrolase